MIILKKENLPQAIDFLQAGKVLIFPTETSYGLGCDATNQKAVNKIFKIKKRSQNKSLLVVVCSVTMGKKYLVWNSLVNKLAKELWPGPLTIIGQSKVKLARGVVAPDNTLAIRVSNHKIVKYLSSKLGKPIVATSANLAGKPNIYKADKIIESFMGKKYQPDIFLNIGNLPIIKPSTLVSVVGDKLQILRQGDIKIKG